MPPLTLAAKVLEADRPLRVRVCPVASVIVALAFDPLSADRSAPVTTRLSPTAKSEMVSPARSATLPVKVSFPSPPTRMSAKVPLPPTSRSAPAPPDRVSAPAPPDSVLAASPPSSESLPPAPDRVSRPAPPDSRSFPSAPRSQSFPLPPRRVSLPTFRPRITSSPAPPARRSAPALRGGPQPGWAPAPPRTSTPAMLSRPNRVSAPSPPPLIENLPSVSADPFHMTASELPDALTARVWPLATVPSLVVMLCAPAVMAMVSKLTSVVAPKVTVWAAEIASVSVPARPSMTSAAFSAPARSAVTVSSDVDRAGVSLPAVRLAVARTSP